MKERIGYIDAIKGFAIVLVVLGHTIGWSFESFNPETMPGGLIFIRQLVYSFHMPLFMFCSGLFFPSPSQDGGLYRWSMLLSRKRFISLMIPWAVMGGGIYLYNGILFLYWYLISLFLYYILNIAVVIFLHLIKRYSEINECIVYFVLSAIILLISVKVAIMYEGTSVISLRMYPYFCMGIIFSRLNLIEGLKEKKYNFVYSLSIVLFSVSFLYLFLYKPHGVIALSLGVIAAITGVVVTFMYFSQTNQSWLFSKLQVLGQHSLDIYLLHYFFLINLPILGNFYLFQFENYNIGGVLVPQLVISLILTIVNICLCITVSSIIQRSSFLSLLLLGRKKKI